MLYAQIGAITAMVVTPLHEPHSQEAGLGTRIGRHTVFLPGYS
jgi:hypothetical protein